MPKEVPPQEIHRTQKMAQNTTKKGSHKEKGKVMDASNKNTQGSPIWCKIKPNYTYGRESQDRIPQNYATNI